MCSWQVIRLCPSLVIRAHDVHDPYFFEDLQALTMGVTAPFSAYAIGSAEEALRIFRVLSGVEGLFVLLVFGRPIRFISVVSFLPF
jgi:hypothetical protein